MTDPGGSSTEALAVRLALVLPDQLQDQARHLILERLLPALTQGSESVDLEVIADQAEDLIRREVVGQPDPLAALRNVALRQQLQGWLRISLHLAAARYLADHPGAADQVPPGWAGLVPDPIPPAEEVRDAASSALHSFEDWRAHGEDEQAEGEATSSHLLLIQANLGAARGGRFDSPLGPLADFLRAVGEPVDVPHLF